MRIGVLGGAFNPVHLAHLNTAQEVMYKTSLDRVYFVVAARPPHKEDETLADFEDRYRMVELATADNSAFYPSRVEMERPGPSYTIDTMRRFQERFGHDVHFITGQDAMEDIGSWKSAAALLKTCGFIVATRPGYDPAALEDVMQGVLSVRYKNIKLNVIGRAGDGSVETLRVEGAGTMIRLVRVTSLDISSTEIRRRLRAGEPVKYLVPDGVEKYLHERGLFADNK